jgi:hypothetical protein
MDPSRLGVLCFELVHIRLGVHQRVLEFSAFHAGFEHRLLPLSNELYGAFEVSE